MAWRRLRFLPPSLRPPQYELARRFVRQHGLIVQGGPFQGMRYVREALYVAEAVTPKLVGSYELEVVDAVERALGRRPHTIVNIGAADGYYAVGLALRAPDAEVLAIDIDPSARRVCRRMAAANGVQARVRVCEDYDLALLDPSRADRTLVVSDCEGCEEQLLVPSRAPVLAGCVLLVELHGVLRPGSEEAVLARFEATHAVELIESRIRSSAALDERRPGPMRWAFLTPR